VRCNDDRQVLREELSRTRRSRTGARRFSRPSGGHLAGYQLGTARRGVHVARVSLARAVHDVVGPRRDGKDSLASWTDGFVTYTRHEFAVDVACHVSADHGATVCGFVAENDERSTHLHLRFELLGRRRWLGERERLRVSLVEKQRPSRLDEFSTPSICSEYASGMRAVRTAAGD
jgi:hypothetical protein